MSWSFNLVLRSEMKKDNVKVCMHPDTLENYWGIDLDDSKVSRVHLDFDTKAIDPVDKIMSRINPVADNNGVPNIKFKVRGLD